MDDNFAHDASNVIGLEFKDGLLVVGKVLSWRSAFLLSAVCTIVTLLFFLFQFSEFLGSPELAFLLLYALLPWIGLFPAILFPNYLSFRSQLRATASILICVLLVGLMFALPMFDTPLEKVFDAFKEKGKILMMHSFLGLIFSLFLKFSLIFFQGKFGWSLKKQSFKAIFTY